MTEMTSEENAAIAAQVATLLATAPPLNSEQADALRRIFASVAQAETQLAPAPGPAEQRRTQAMRLDPLLMEIGRTHLWGWNGYPRDESKDGQPRHSPKTCYKCAVLSRDEETRAQIWALRPAVRPADQEPAEESARLAPLLLDAGELRLLKGLLRADVNAVQANVELAQSEELRTLLKARVVMAMSLLTAVSEAYYSVAASITCPRCGTTSYNPTDVIEGYCGNCHDRTVEPGSARVGHAELARQQAEDEPDKQAVARRRRPTWADET